MVYSCLNGDKMSRVCGKLQINAKYYRRESGNSHKKHLTIKVTLELDKGETLSFYVFKRDVRELFGGRRRSASIFRDNGVST